MKERVIKIIKNFKNVVKRIFGKKNKLLLSGEGMKFSNNKYEFKISEIIEKEKEKPKESNEDIKNITEKERIINIYQKIKEGKILLENLVITDLIKIQLMLKTENDMYENMIKRKEQNIRDLDFKINSLKTQQ